MLPLEKKPDSRAKEDWTECAPFVKNSRAVLIHRPRYVCTHQIGPQWREHISIQCWCGTSFSGLKQFTFLETVPEGELLCERCEVAAFKYNQPTAQELCGGHVHLGKLVAVQTCCQKEQNNG
jgi:hypothetical protein